MKMTGAQAVIKVRINADAFLLAVEGVFSFGVTPRAYAREPASW